METQMRTLFNGCSYHLHDINMASALWTVILRGASEPHNLACMHTCTYDNLSTRSLQFHNKTWRLTFDAACELAPCLPKSGQNQQVLQARVLQARDCVGQRLLEAPKARGLEH